MAFLGDLWVRLGLKNENLKKGINESKQMVGKLSSALTKIGGAMAAAFSTKAIVDFTNKAATLANTAKAVKNAFDKFASPTLLDDLRNATQGAVSDLQLMQRAVQANNFKLPLDQLATYMAFAAKRARETGESVDYLVDSIILGLSRQSVMILDNLGISALEIRKRMKEVGSMTQAVGDIIRDEMGDGAEVIDKMAISTERLAAAWTNFMVSFAEGTGVKTAWNWIKSQLADKLDEAARVMASDKITKWGKWNYLTSLGTSGWMLKGALDQDRAEEEKAKADLEEYGPPIPKGFKAKTEETKAVKGLIKQLEEEIKKKEEIRDLSYNKDEIRQINDEIEALKKRVHWYQMSTSELSKFKKEELAFGKVSKESSLESIWEKASKDAATGDKALREAAKNHMNTQNELVDLTDKNSEIMADASNMLVNSMMSGITGSLNELANVITGVEEANIGTVLKTLLSPLADACIAAGLLIMTTGEGIEALKASLISFFGGSAIAAGAALMAIGAAAKVGLAAIGRNSGKRGGSSSSYSTSFSGGMPSPGYGGFVTSESAQPKLVAEVRGKDLLFVIDNARAEKRR